MVVQDEALFTGFANRAEGGHRLAAMLRRYRGKADAIVIGLPRGGIATAAAVAEDLDLPLDVLVVRKLGTPDRDELAMGAIATGGMRVINHEVVSSRHIPPEVIEAAARREEVVRKRRESLYRGAEPPPRLEGKVVIVIDDGLATGATMAAAVAVIRSHRPARIVLAVPVAPLDMLERFRWVVDEVIFLETPDPFTAVGYWYVDFAPVEDSEVVELLERARSRAKAPA